ncbi:MAG: hypothetical protein SVK08_09610 [Halobacteriota archaeon]|nr:hypothetical protein [Halobacteriota archaeon]
MRINKIIGLLVLVSMLTVVIAPTPALAAGRFGSFRGWGRADDGKELAALETSIESLESDGRKMGFLYKNMDDAEIPVVKIVITKNNGDLLKTFYVVSHEGVLEESEVSDGILSDPSITTITMTVKEAKDGIKLFKGDKINFGLAVNGARLYSRVEKENMPPLDETIEKLDWLDEYPHVKRMAVRLL